MLYPPKIWEIDLDYNNFQAFLKNISVVNDEGQRAVKEALEIV